MKSLSTAKKNIAGAALSKLVSMAIAVFSVPILLQLIGTEQYGTWVTLTSLIAVIGMLDLGVGNSLRNSVAGMVDPSSADAVRHEFVAFFHMLCGIALITIVILYAAFAAFPLLERNRGPALLLYVPLLALLPFLLSASVLQGARAIGLQSFLQSAGGWLFFLFIATCHWLSLKPDLLQLSLAWSCFYALLLFIMFWLATRILQVPLKQLRQWSLRGIPKGRLKVGISFLILQLSALILYSLGNAIIYHSLGAGEVARYDVVNKIFQVGLGFYTIVIGVMWSEIARLRALNDFSALQVLYKKMVALALAFCVAAFLVACITPWLVDIWTSHKLQVRKHEAFAIAALVSLQAMAYVGAVFMNAFEQVRQQVILSIFSVVMMVPAALYLVSRGQGIASVPLAAAMLTLLPMIVCNIKAVALIRQTPSGVQPVSA